MRRNALESWWKKEAGQITVSQKRQASPTPRSQICSTEITHQRFLLWNGLQGIWHNLGTVLCRREWAGATDWRTTHPVFQMESANGWTKKTPAWPYENNMKSRWFSNCQNQRDFFEGICTFLFYLANFWYRKNKDWLFHEKMLNISLCLSEDLQSIWLLKWDKIQWILPHFF